MNRSIEEVNAEYSKVSEKIAEIKTKLADIRSSLSNKIKTNTELSELNQRESEANQKLLELEKACGKWVNVWNNDGDWEADHFNVTNKELYQEYKPEIERLRKEVDEIQEKRYTIRKQIEAEGADIRTNLSKELNQLTKQLNDLKKELVELRTNKAKEDSELTKVIDALDNISEWDHDAVFAEDELTVNDDDSVNLTFYWDVTCDDFDDDDYFDSGEEVDMEKQVAERAKEVLEDIVYNVSNVLEDLESPYQTVSGKEKIDIEECDIRVTKYDSWNASWDEPAGYEMETDGDATVKLTVVISK